MTAVRSRSARLAGRDAILKAARAEFAGAGFHGATMRDIAERAGVSQGLLHHHFSSKDGLWSAVGEAASSEFMDYVAAAVKPQTLDKEAIGSAVRTYLQYWRDHPEAFRINLWRLLDGPTAERKSRSRRLTETAVPFFKKAQEAGALRTDIPVGLLLCVAGSLVQFWLHSQIELRDAIEIGGDALPDDETMIRYIVKLIEAA